MRLRRSVAQIESDRAAGVKPCYRCSRVLSLDNFNRSTKSPDGRHAECRECQSLRLRRDKYGITRTELEELIEAQNGACAVCGNPWEVVDHDHATGAVRGLLCQLCNRGIGMLGDSASRAQSAARYLAAGRI